MARRAIVAHRRRGIRAPTPDGAVTTTVKVTNVFNQTIQQHIFGDLLRRTVVGEVKFKL